MRTHEIIDAMGVSRSGYYLARDAGRLVTADHLVRVADSLGLNAVDLLVRFGLVSAEAVLECAGNLDDVPAPGKGRGRRLRRLPGTPPL